MERVLDDNLLLVAALVCSVFVLSYARAAAVSDPTGVVVLVSGETLCSQGREFCITLEDCDLKVYNQDHELIWQQGTTDEYENVECQLSLESDGNALIFRGTNLLWASNILTVNSKQGENFLVCQDKGILFRRDDTWRVLVATSTEEESGETNVNSIEFDIPTVSALNHLSPDVDVIPQFIESPVHSSPQSKIWLKNSPAHSSTPARDCKKASRQYLFFSQSPILSSPQTEASPVDSTPHLNEFDCPSLNSPAQSSSSPSKKYPVNSTPLSDKGNSLLDSTPIHAGNTPQHEVFLHVSIESPSESAPSTKGVPVSSSSPSQLMEAPVQSIPVSDKSSSPWHASPAVELRNDAPALRFAPVRSTQSVPLSSTTSTPDHVPERSSPQSELGSSPRQLSPLSGVKNAPVRSERFNSPLLSSPRSEFGNVPGQSSPSLRLSNTPVDSTPSLTFESPVRSSPSQSQSTGKSPMHSTRVSAVSSPQSPSQSSPVHSAPAVAFKSSPVDSSTPVRSTHRQSEKKSPATVKITPTLESQIFLVVSNPTPSTRQLNNAPLDTTEAVELRSSSPVESTPCHSAQMTAGFVPGNSAPVHSSPESNNAPKVSSLATKFDHSPADSSPVHSACQPHNSPVDFSTPSGPSVEFRNSPVDSTPVRSSPELNSSPIESTHTTPSNAPVFSSPRTSLRGSRQFGSPILQVQSA